MGVGDLHRKIDATPGKPAPTPPQEFGSPGAEDLDEDGEISACTKPAATAERRPDSSYVVNKSLDPNVDMGTPCNRRGVDDGSPDVEMKDDICPDTGPQKSKPRKDTEVKSSKHKVKSAAVVKLPMFAELDKLLGEATLASRSGTPSVGDKEADGVDETSPPSKKAKTGSSSTSQTPKKKASSTKRSRKTPKSSEFVEDDDVDDGKDGKDGKDDNKERDLGLDKLTPDQATKKLRTDKWNRDLQTVQNWRFSQGINLNTLKVDNKDDHSGYIKFVVEEGRGINVHDSEQWEKRLIAEQQAGVAGAGKKLKALRKVLKGKLARVSSKGVQVPPTYFLEAFI